MTMKSGGFLWRKIYERIKMPIIPIWGGFPVKLITHIGALARHSTGMQSAIAI
jgi:hypothetical protein